MAIVLAWFFAAFFIAFVFGEGREIGFWKSFLISVLLSPLVGLFVTLVSEEMHKVVERRRTTELLELQANSQKEVHRGSALTDDLEMLDKLKEQGYLSPENYEAAKKKLLT